MNTINHSVIMTQVSCPHCSFEKTVPLSKYKDGARLQCPQPGCQARFSYRIHCVFDSKHYTDISPDAFTHPLDRKAIGALRNVPGFDFALRKMMEYGYEKILRVNSMADDIKVTPRTCGYIHEMAVEAAASLGITTPDVFINQNPYPNAATFGVEYPLITIQSGLIELLTADELYAVIAHEMAHIKCHHVLYHMLANFLLHASSLLGIVGGFIVPLNLALLEWSRKAELSADRGALIVTNNRRAAIKLLMKLAGGSRHVAEMIDEDEFVRQARQFEKITAGIGLNKFYRLASNITRSHPFPVLRAYELQKWARGPEYRTIYDGDYPRRSGSADDDRTVAECPHCGEKLDSGVAYCQKCGQNPTHLENQYDFSGYETLVAGVKGGLRSAFNRLAAAKNQWQSEGHPKICPQCGTVVLDPEVRHCPADGSELIVERRNG